jgi:creatinine amidohydrolase
MRGAETRLEGLSVQWEELTASDFPEAVARSRGVCVLPLGVIEKHGPHLPLGTDVMVAREIALRAASREYVVVFPSYYFGQIWEARHQPGCITLPPELLTPLLQAVCDEIHRNGFRKTAILSGHGGNRAWLSYFCQSQLASRRQYAVLVAGRSLGAEVEAQLERMRKSEVTGHADEQETSLLQQIRPDLVNLARASTESGLPQGRLGDLTDSAFTGIAWYADFPNHYAGIAADATTELGSFVLEAEVRSLVQVLRLLKEDQETIPLQNEFFARSERPLG